MAPTRERRLTATERLWLAADDVARDAGATPFVIETYAVGVGEPDRRTPPQRGARREYLN